MAFLNDVAAAGRSRTRSYRPSPNLSGAFRSIKPEARAANPIRNPLRSGEGPLVGTVARASSPTRMLSGSLQPLPVDRVAAQSASPVRLTTARICFPTRGSPGEMPARTGMTICRSKPKTRDSPFRDFDRGRYLSVQSAPRLFIMAARPQTVLASAPDPMTVSPVVQRRFLSRHATTAR